MYYLHSYLIVSSTLFHIFFLFNDTATTEIYTLSLHDALPISRKIDIGEDDAGTQFGQRFERALCVPILRDAPESLRSIRSEEHTSELQSRLHLVCRLLLEKKKKKKKNKNKIISQYKSTFSAST